MIYIKSLQSAKCCALHILPCLALIHYHEEFVIIIISILQWEMMNTEVKWLVQGHKLLGFGKGAQEQGVFSSLCFDNALDK